MEIGGSLVGSFANELIIHGNMWNACDSFANGMIFFIEIGETLLTIL